TLASSGMDGVVKLWNPASGKARATLNGPVRRTGQRGTETKRLNSAAISPDGKLLATDVEENAYKASPKEVDEKTVLLWDAGAAKPLEVVLRGHTNAGNAMAFSPDGKLLALAGDEGALDKPVYVVNLWDVSTGKVIASIPGHEQSIRFTAFSP